jgi:hypothetical protein
MITILVILFLCILLFGFEHVCGAIVSLFCMLAALAAVVLVVVIIGGMLLALANL